MAQRQQPAMPSNRMEAKSGNKRLHMADMAHDTAFPKQHEAFLQIDREPLSAQNADLYLICLFFVVLTALAIYVMFHCPATWDLSQ